MTVISAAAMRCKTMADGSLRIEAEVEPADAQAAFALFGRPGAPMALAALVQGHAAVKDEPDPPLKGGALAKLAGQLCQDEEFQQWLAEKRGAAWGACMTSPLPDDDEMAAAVIRHICGIESRAELDHTPAAAATFHTHIRQPFVERHRA